MASPYHEILADTSLSDGDRCHVDSREKCESNGVCCGESRCPLSPLPQVLLSNMFPTIGFYPYNILMCKTWIVKLLAFLRYLHFIGVVLFLSDM